MITFLEFESKYQLLFRSVSCSSHWLWFEPCLIKDTFDHLAVEFCEVILLPLPCNDRHGSCSLIDAGTVLTGRQWPWLNEVPSKGRCSEGERRQFYASRQWKRQQPCGPWTSPNRHSTCDSYGTSSAQRRWGLVVERVNHLCTHFGCCEV